MIDQPFRAFLSHRVATLLAIYKLFRLTPNHITILGCIISLTAAFFISSSPFWAIMLWWLGRLLDGTDGIYARDTGQVSDFGGYLDILCDMLAYSGMIVGFALAHPESLIQWLAILVGYVLCITSALALGSLAKERDQHQDNRSLHLASGLAEGGETGGAYTLFLLLPGYVECLSTLWLVILCITVFARSYLAYKVLT